MPSYPEIDAGEEETSSWEKALFQEIKRCVKEVWIEAGRPPQVLLAVDGVVPMAKIRQQRARRFKSAWLKRDGTGGGFDTNSITPGTLFMDKLTTVLEELAKERTGWEVSSVREPGEGEHKVLQWLRKGSVKQKGNVIVYGLDADLILLTMLVEEEIGMPIFLMREKEEFGSGGGKAGAEVAKQEYQFMNLGEFKKRLGVKGYAETLNYIGLMNLMGNDFLPHSITHKLNDDGHEYVMQEKRSGTIVVYGEPGQRPEIDWKVLQEVCSRWAKDEEEKIAGMVAKKRDQAKRGVLKGMEEREGLPLEWNVEKILFEKEGGKLLENWRDTYWDWIQKDAQKQFWCQEYWKGFKWILDYYTGHEVDMFWTFKSWLPPLWSDLAQAVADKEKTGSEEKINQAPITPDEQLAMVLPLDSWGLIRKKEHKRLPLEAPQFWPFEFGFQSAGRKWLWECEAMLPSLTAARMREILAKEK